ncbi:MAG: hypothetical protein ABWY05_17860 [Noviherbaspirillum sp.]
MPCGAKQSRLPPAPAPSDPASARRQAASERQQLAAMEKDREKARAALERQQQQRGKDKSAQAHKKRCALLALEKKWSAEDAASAARSVSDKSLSLDRHARRKAERYEAECASS